MSPSIDFKAIAAAALPHANELLQRWLPDGTLSGKEYTSRNPTRDDRNPGSFRISLDGPWCDFSTGDKGGDTIALAAYIFQISQTEAATYLAAAIGLESPGNGLPEQLKEAFAPVEVESVVLIESANDEQHQPADAGPGDSFLRGSKFGRVPDHQWHYRDRANRVALTVCRYATPHGKEILQCTPWIGEDHNLVWKWRGLPGKRPLYDLPGLLDNPDKSVLIVEGERCVDAARQLVPENWIVTTWAGGANAVSKTDFSILNNRDVRIWADADQPGRKAASEIEKLLPMCSTYGDHAIAQRRKVKGALPEGYDAADAIEEGLTQADFANLFRGQSEKQMEILEAADMAELYPNEARPIIEGLLREGENANLIGSTKTRKSFAVLQLAMSVATGREWLGFHCHQGKVLLIDNELKKEGLTQRISMVSAAIGISPEDLRGKLHVVSLRGKLRGLDDLSRELIKLNEGSYDLVILDAMYRMYPKGYQENDNAAATSLYNTIDYTAERMKAAFVMVHHASKGIQSGKATVDVGSGAGAMSRATDAHITILPHIEQDKVVLTAGMRSWVSPTPRVLAWDPAGRWLVDPHADPTQLAGSKEPGDINAAKGCLIGLLKDDPTPVAVLKAAARRRRVKWPDMESALAEAEDAGHAFSWEQDRRRVWSLKPRPEKTPSKTSAVKEHLAQHPEDKVQDVAKAFGVDPALVRQAKRSLSE